MGPSSQHLKRVGIAKRSYWTRPKIGTMPKGGLRKTDDIPKTLVRVIGRIKRGPILLNNTGMKGIFWVLLPT